VDRFYGDGDHHVNMGHTESQLCVCRSYCFTSTYDNVFSAYGGSRPIDPSQCLSLMPHQLNLAPSCVLYN
jgi:hypothetical protein